MTIKVRVLSPLKFIGDFKAEEVVLPGKTGQIGALKRHTGLYTALDTGLVRLKCQSKWVPIIVCGGFAEISYNRIVVLAYETEELKDISREEAEEELERASLAFINMEISEGKTLFDLSIDLKKATAQLRAINYLSLNIL